MSRTVCHFLFPSAPIERLHPVRVLYNSQETPFLFRTLVLPAADLQAYACPAVRKTSVSRIRASNTCSPCLLRTRTDRLLKALSERLSFLHPENTYDIYMNTYDIYMYVFIYTNKSFILVFPYTVYNLFINMAMPTNIIYYRFIFKSMPMVALA